MSTVSLDATEAECAEGRTAPRVSLADIEANIDNVAYVTGDQIFEIRGVPSTQLAYESCSVLTICLVTTKCGFNIVGKSAPASYGNFDAELGRKLAYEDAVRQLWPLMGYALRARLASEPA